MTLFETIYFKIRTSADD